MSRHSRLTGLTAAYMQRCPVRRARKLVADCHKLKIRRIQDKRIIKGFQVALQETKKKAEESAQRLMDETKKHENLQR